MQWYAFLSVCVLMYFLKLLLCQNTFIHWLQFYIFFICFYSHVFFKTTILQDFFTLIAMICFFICMCFNVFLKTPIVSEYFYTLIAILYFLHLFLFSCVLQKYYLARILFYIDYNAKFAHLYGFSCFARIVVYIDCNKICFICIYIWVFLKLIFGKTIFVHWLQSICVTFWHL